MRTVRVTCSCGKPAHDGYLCRHCRRALARILADLPGLDSDLEITATRRDRLGGATDMVKSTRMFGPLPFEPNAAAHRHVLRNALVSCIRALNPDADDWPADRIGPMCAWLTAHVPDIARTEGAGETLDELRGIRATARKLIDAQPPSSVPVGPCPEVDDEDASHCGGFVFVWFHPDREAFPPVMKCNTCPKSWGMSDWNDTGERIKAEIARQVKAQELAESIMGA